MYDVVDGGMGGGGVCGWLLVRWYFLEQWKYALDVIIKM
jgi:hypothetical protein